MSSAKRSNEPIVWFLFGVGGFVVAYFLPIHIVLYGLAFPLGLAPDPGYDTTRMLAEALRRHGLAGRGVACHARAVG